MQASPNKLAHAVKVPEEQEALLNLNVPQYAFYTMNKAFRAFVGGYRSGKTFLGCVRLCALALEYPNIKLGYFAPTYPQIRDIFYSTISTVAELMGMTCEIKTSNNEVSLYYYNQLHAVIKCRSMEKPERIVGFDINHALVDEIDCMKKEKADAAWKKIIARLSSKGFDEKRLYDEELNAELVIEALQENTVDFTTTPEGFNWIYDFFVKQLKSDPELQKYYGIVHASTKQNAKNLPDDYIDKLYATYPANLVDAYVDGKFVNLTSGAVYPSFCRVGNNSNVVWDGKEEVRIGMDFNVNKMSAVIHVKRGSTWHAVNEFFKLADTPAMIEKIKEVYADARKIYVYPDSSGHNTSSKSASVSDHSLLEDAGFSVVVDGVNPAVRDRLVSMNSAFFNAKEQTSYYVNTELCPEYTACLEQQTYAKNGEPDKTNDLDHLPDAGGYFIAKVLPVIKPAQDVSDFGYAS